MLFLATFFPTSGDDDDVYLDKEVPFEAVTEFLKLTVDLADLIGIYLVMQRVAGKGQVKEFLKLTVDLADLIGIYLVTQRVAG